MSDVKMKEIRSDIDELKQLSAQATRKKVQDLLSLEIRKLETEWVRLKESQPASSAAPMDVSPSPTTSAPQTKRYQVKLNGYGWDQSDKYVKVFVTLKDAQTIPKDQVFCKLTDRSMELNVVDLNGKDYVLTINNLLEPIIVEDSHWKQKTDMVVIFLAKSRPNVKWSHMTEIEKKFDNQRKNRFKEPDAEPDPTKDPQDSIMSLMKNMYETGDDEMKRMITKAWYEGQQKQMSDKVNL